MSPAWLLPPLALLAGLATVSLFAWGFAVQRLVRRIEAAHPALHRDLASRARGRKAPRLAASTALQNALFRNEALPGLDADPAAARLLKRERLARLTLMGSSFGALVLFVAILSFA